MRTPEPSQWSASEPSEWTDDSDSVEIIMDDLSRRINFPKFSPKFDNSYWWLPKLQQPSQRHMNEFNNFSDHYLCNSVWWEVPTYHQ
jgi:hypothetical protein